MKKTNRIRKWCTPCIHGYLWCPEIERPQVKNWRSPSKSPKWYLISERWRNFRKLDRKQETQDTHKWSTVEGTNSKTAEKIPSITHNSTPARAVLDMPCYFTALLHMSLGCPSYSIYVKNIYHLSRYGLGIKYFLHHALLTNWANWPAQASSIFIKLSLPRS